MAKAKTKTASRADKAADKEATRKVKFEELERVGATIKALADKIREHDKTVVIATIKAQEDAIGKSDSFRATMVAELKKALPLCKAAGVKPKDFQKKYVGKFMGLTKLKQLVRVARGDITFEEIKLIEREKKQRQRAAAKPPAAPAAPEPMTGVKFARLAKSAADGDGEARRELLAAGCTLVEGQWAAPDDKTEPGIPEPVEAAPVVADAPPTQPEPLVVEAPHVLTAEEVSDDALTAFKAACNTHCPNMTDADLKAARVYFVGLAVGKEGWRPKIKKAA